LRAKRKAASAQRSAKKLPFSLVTLKLGQILPNNCFILANADCCSPTLCAEKNYHTVPAKKPKANVDEIDPGTETFTLIVLFFVKQ